MGKEVCIIGLGYVGLTLSLTLTNHGNKVYGVETNKSIVKSLNNKENKSNMKKSKKNNSLTKPTDLEFIINIKDDKLHNSLKKINKNEAPWGWGLWVALENGYLQINGKKKKWTTFPKNTPIGIRGPLILWDKLDKLPNIYNLYL